MNTPSFNVPWREWSIARRYEHLVWEPAEESSGFKVGRLGYSWHFLFLAVVVWIGIALALRAEARECLVAVDSESDQLIVVDATDFVIRFDVRLPSRIAVGCAREAGWTGLGATRIDGLRETGVVATSTGTCVVDLFDWHQSRFIGTFNIGHPLDSTAVRFSRDGSYLAVANTAPGSERRGMSLVDMRTLQVREIPTAAHADLVEHRDGSFYTFGGGSLGLHRVDPISGESSRLSFSDGFAFRRIAFSPNGRWLFASAREDGGAPLRYLVFDLDSGEVVDSRESRTIYSGPSGARVYLVTGDKVEVIDANTRLRIDEFDTMGLRVGGLVFSADESRMFGIVPITDRAIPYVRIAAFDLGNGSVDVLSMDGDHCGRIHGPPFSSNPNARCVPTEMTVVRCSCPVDCDDNDRVTIDELIVGVGLALSNGDSHTCSAADLDRDREVSVSEIVSGVRAALDGCE